MNCNTVNERLDAYLDGTLTRSEAAGLEQHFAACADCNQRMEGLRRILDMASGLPRSVEPATDLWPGIAVRLDRPETVVRGRFGSRSGSWMAVAAMVVLSVTVVLIAYTFGRSQAQTVVVDRWATPLAVQASLGTNSIEAVAAEFVEARTELLEALEQRRGSLSDETLAVVNDNLEVIDGAILRISAALETDPNNRMLRGQLTSAYQQQIQLLWRANTLPAEI